MVEKIGMGASDPAGNRLERDRLRARFDQQIAGCRQRHAAACFGGQASLRY